MLPWSQLRRIQGQHFYVEARELITWFQLYTQASYNLTNSNSKPYSQGYNKRFGFGASQSTLGFQVGFALYCLAGPVGSKLKFWGLCRIYSIMLRYVALRYVTLRYATLRYTTLHYIALNCIKLHCIALHYITFH